MLTSIRGLVAASVLAAGLAATPAFADETDPPSDFTISGNAAIVSDYRFRGLSLSGGDFAGQAGIGVSHSSGFYVGTWASNIQGADKSVQLDNGLGVVGSYDNGSFGSMELDLFAGWTGKVSSALTADVGLLYYVYPNAKNRTALAASIPGPSGYPKFLGYTDYDTDYFEPYASLTYAFGPATAKLGIAYAWDQSALGHDDNLYIYTDLGSSIPNTPVSVSAHLGYTDGALSPDLLTGKGTGGGFDYSVGATYNITPKLAIGVSYVGVDGDSIDGFSDDTVVGTLKLTF